LSIERHPEAVKLFKNIKRFSDIQTAESIAFGVFLPLSPSKEQCANWVEYIASKLEEKFDEATIKRIRMGCYCRENGRLDESKKWLRELYIASENLEQFVDKVNEYSAGWYIKDGELYTKYFDCPCPMLEGTDQLTTKTWCHCTAGFAIEIFDDVFGYEVDTEVLESIKLGSEFCLIKVTRR
jgi:predicted hydrocarbon binding protein